MAEEEKEKIDFYKECKDLVESEVYCDITEWVDYIIKTEDFWEDNDKCPLVRSDIECRSWEQEDDDEDYEDDEDEDDNDEESDTKENVDEEEDEYAEHGYKVEYDPDKEFEYLCAYYVSDWLADKLYEQGEIVARFQYKNCIWFRQTFGQCICLDGEIMNIVRDLLVSRKRCTRKEADALRFC